MSKINEANNGFYKFYLIGIFIILALPLLTIPPWFFPPDWGKTAVFRSVLSILLFLFAFQFLYKRNELKLPTVKKNKIIWLLFALFIIFLLATIFSTDTLFSLWGSPYRAGGFITFAFYFLFAILTFFVLKDHDWNKVWTFSFFTGILVSFIAIIQYYGLFNRIFISDADRPPSTLGNPILLGIYLLLLIFLALSFAIKETHLAKRIFYYFTALLFLYVILITGSRAAYLGFLVGITYFVLFYPIKKLLKLNGKIAILKIVLVALLVTASLTVYYVNSRTEYPQILQKNRIFQAMRPRLSIEMFLQDPRFSAWQVGFSALKEKPILGWGPENFAIGFDKNYRPSLPYINKEWGGWWDKAHNIILDIGVQAGIPTAIIYLALFVILFWQLQKLKNTQRELATISENPIIPHGIQATLIGYFTANFFSFDSFATYLIFFFIIGYTLHLTTQTQDKTQNAAEQKRARWKLVIIFVSILALIIFLWQYNFLPLQINGQIQKANLLARDGKCENALSLMDNALKNRSFLDAYIRIQYIEDIKVCAEFYPENNLKYAEKGIQLMKKAVEIRPSYSRLWIFLGSFTTIKANAEPDQIKKEILIKEAISYLQKAKELAPNHQEVIIEQGKADMVAGDYKSMKEKAEKCIELDPILSDCYWEKTLSEIYLRETDEAKNDLQIFINQYGNLSITKLRQLSNAFSVSEDYQNLAIIYQQLIKISPNVAQYHSSLAFTYFKMGEYKKAKEEAMIFLELMPEAEDEVNNFLKMLPY